MKIFWGVYDAITASAVDRAGQDGMWLSSLCVSAAQGLPDSELVGIETQCQLIQRIRRISKLPVWVDCDTGYGSSQNLAYASQLLSAAGANAICVEDKAFPKRNTFSKSNQKLEEVGSFQKKILAVKRASNDGISLIARTDALALGCSVDNTITRAKAFAQSGADALFVSSTKQNTNELYEFLERWEAQLPVIVVPTSYAVPDIERLEFLGVSTLIYANQILRSSIRAADQILRSFQEKGDHALRGNEQISIGELLRRVDCHL